MIAGTLFIPYAVAKEIEHQSDQWMSRFAKSLRKKVKSSRLFESVSSMSIVPRIFIDMMTVRPLKKRALKQASYRAASFEAEAPDKNLRLMVLIQSIETKEPVLPVSRIVPSCWISMEISASKDITRKISNYGRTNRLDDGVQLLFTDDELTKEKVDEILAALSGLIRAVHTVSMSCCWLLWGGDAAT